MRHLPGPASSADGCPPPGLPGLDGGRCGGGRSHLALLLSLLLYLLCPAALPAGALERSGQPAALPGPCHPAVRGTGSEREVGKRERDKEVEERRKGHVRERERRGGKE